MSGDLFRQNVLNENSELPFYLQIYSQIKHLINSGALKPGELLPGELQLCEIYKVSRTTIRQALDQLSEENIIIRQRGRGSYVASPKLHRSLDHLYSFSEDMREMGFEPSSRVIESSVIKSQPQHSSALSIPTASDLFKLARIRFANNEPILFETTYIPYFLCKGIENEDFSVTSLYSILQYKYNLKLGSAIENYEAVKLDRESASLLGCKASSPAFLIRRIAYLESGIPIELTEAFARSDKCVFTVELKSEKNKVLFSRKIIP